MNIELLSVDAIDDRDRLRLVNPDYVREVERSIRARKGVMTPIEVRKDAIDGKHRLVAGAHRLAGAKKAGLKQVPVIFFAGTEQEARLREIDENLVRNELSALDRARFIAEREKIAPDAAAMGAELSSARAYIAEKMGISDRWVRKLLELHRAMERLPADLRSDLAVSGFANKRSELMALAAIEDADEQRAVVEELLSGRKDGAKSVAAARRKLSDALPEHADEDQKAFDAFVVRWAKYSPAMKRRVSEYVAHETKARTRALGVELKAASKTRNA